MARAAGLRGVDDVLGLPLLLLAAGAGRWSWCRPRTMSRGFERRADRFALDLTKNPHAFVSAMRRLGAEPRGGPSKVVQWLFYSHPPILIASPPRRRSWPEAPRPDLRST